MADSRVVLHFPDCAFLSRNLHRQLSQDAADRYARAALVVPEFQTATNAQRFSAEVSELCGSPSSVALAGYHTSQAALASETSLLAPLRSSAFFRDIRTALCPAPHLQSPQLSVGSTQSTLLAELCSSLNPPPQALEAPVLLWAPQLEVQALPSLSEIKHGWGIALTTEGQAAGHRLARRPLQNL